MAPRAATERVDLRIVGRLTRPPQPSTRAVEAWLVSHAPSGQWTGPQGQIALGTELSTKTVGRAIGWLREHGYIKTDPVPRTPGLLTYYIEAPLLAADEVPTSNVGEVRTPRTLDVRTPQTSADAAHGATPSSLSSAGPDLSSSDSPNPSDIRWGPQPDLRSDGSSDTQEDGPTRRAWRGIPLARVLHEAVGEETLENLHMLAGMTDAQVAWAVAKARQCRPELGEINPAYFARICDSARLRLGPDLAAVDGLDELLAGLDDGGTAGGTDPPPGTVYEALTSRVGSSSQRLLESSGSAVIAARVTAGARAGWRRWVRPALRRLDEAIGDGP